MKKFIFIFSGFLLLTITSCKKEEIRPNTYDSQLNDLMLKLNDKKDQPDSSNKFGSSINNKSDIIIIDDSSYTITDPNRDEDDNRKTKRK